MLRKQNTKTPYPTKRFPRVRRMQIELRKLNSPTCPGHPAYATVRMVRGAEDG